MVALRPKLTATYGKLRNQLYFLFNFYDKIIPASAVFTAKLIASKTLACPIWT
jgi:hypothetical protein